MPDAAPVIAIVDDDEAMRQALFDLLHVAGYSASAYGSATEFLTGFAPASIDLLVTDVRMPGMDGLQLQQQVNRLEPTLPVIFVTGSSDPATRRQALADGAFAYLTKPISDETFLRRLDEALTPRGCDEAQPLRGPGSGLVPRVGDPAHRNMDPATTGWCALDVSAARSIMAKIVAGEGPANWVTALLDAVRFKDLDTNAIHSLAPLGSRRRIIDQPVTAHWPPESRLELAELILAAAADFPPGASRSRPITAILFSDAVMNVSLGDDGHSDLVFVSVGGRLRDDRSIWAVRASEERYRNLIHHLPTALLQIDSTAMNPIFEELRLAGVTDIAAYLDEHQGLPLHSRNIVKVTDANLNAVELFGAQSVDRLIGPVDFVFQESSETAKRVITGHFEGRRTYVEVMKMRTFDGRIRDVEMSVTYPTPPERTDITLLSFDDITDRLRTELQLRQLQADFTRAGRIATLGELAASIAHEVNQPLSAITMNAETSLRWLRREHPNLVKVDQLTSRIADNARRALEIVQRIRGMAGRQAPERVSLDINEVIEESALFVRQDLESRSIRLSMALDREIPELLVDRVQFQQVMINLLLNGIQALSQRPGRGGSIDLRTKLVEGKVSILVRDNGPGIAERDLERVFEGFFTTKEEGIGIGLAICQSIILAHGGTITVANHPAGGAEFVILLPARGSCD